MLRNFCFFLQCEFQLCLGKKKGYIADDGTINKKVMETNIAQKFKDNPELFETIKKNCINGDVKEYGHEDICEIKKIVICIHVQFAMVNIILNLSLHI